MFKLFYYIVSILILISNPQLCLSESNLPKSEKTRLGMLLTLSGNYSSAGLDQKKGIEAALDISSSREVFDITYADSRNDPIHAISEFRKLTMQGNASAVLLNRATIGIPLSIISKELKIPILGTVGHNKFVAGNDYAFQLWPTSDEEGSFLANEIHKNGSRKIAVIHTEDEYMSSVVDGFKETFTRLGGVVVFDEAVQANEQNFSTLIIKAQTKKPDTIYFNMSIPQIVSFIKRVREFNITTQLLSNLYTANPEVLKILGANNLEGIFFTEIDTNLPSLKKKLGISPDESIAPLTVSAFVGMMFLAQSVRGINSNHVDSRSLYNALLNQKEVITPDSKYKVINRYVKFPIVLKQMREGKAKSVR